MSNIDLCEIEQQYELINLFLQLCRIPSPPLGEAAVAEKIMQIFKSAGIEAEYDSYGNIIARLPGTEGLAEKQPLLLSAHMDVVGGSEPVNPRLSEDGKYIETDKTRTLGADDKAGIAEIMTAMEYLIAHPEIKHGKIRIGFTPDEEIGRGADKFDVAKFGAEWAYTMDGSEIGELEYENFNAASAKITIQGRNVHPGYAKNKMVNALHLANELVQLLPVNERPEFTEKYEGFFHLIAINGTVDEATVSFIIRDHDRELFEERKKIMENVVAFLNSRYNNRLNLELRDQYYNMREKVEPVKHVVDYAFQAMEEAGITPIVKPIRGGTDGARLSFMGLPCPNIFAGGMNFHGRHEFIPVRAMEKATEVIVRIAELVARKA